MDRYHLTLSRNGRSIMHGWWQDEGTARRKFSSWVRERGEMSGAAITLVDNADGTVIHSWPDET